MLSPENADGSPGNALINQGLRAVFAAGSTEHIEIRNEYLNLSRFQDADHQKFLTAYLQKKYADQKIDLVLAALSSSLDFALEARREVFPGVPVVFIASTSRNCSSARCRPTSSACRSTGTWRA